jgi:endonuclease YncB( thermonuclease family)
MICFYLKLLFLSTLFVATLSVAATLEGHCIAVLDGDTVTILDSMNKQTRVRLMGIDAPEKAQAFGTRSKQALSDLVFSKQVSVEFSKKDKYGRTLGKIIVNGLDANLEQLKAGMAWHYKQYMKEQLVPDRKLYADAEDLARAERRGLWIDKQPIEPWMWRKDRK